MTVLEALRKRVTDPAQLALALQAEEGVKLTEWCFLQGDAYVRKTALEFLLDGLRLLGPNDLNAETSEMMKTLLEIIRTRVLNKVANTWLFESIFADFGVLCSYSRAHRDVFLQEFPIAQLKEFDVFCCPSDALTSYTELIIKILGQGRSDSPIFASILGIFKKTLLYPGIRCNLVRDVCASIYKAFEAFKEEDPIRAVVNSSIIENLVRHTEDDIFCKNECGHS